MKPLTKRYVNTVLDSISASYRSLEVEKQFQVSALVLKLETLLQTDSKGMSIEHSSGGLTVDIPSKDLISRQPNKRLMSSSEKRQRAKTKQRTTLPGKGNFYSMIVCSNLHVSILSYSNVSR